MTDKDLNHAIATKLGWKDIPPIPGREHLFDGYMLKPDAKSESDIDKVPDFTKSTDAMKGPENWLRANECYSEYCRRLQKHYEDEGCSEEEAWQEAVGAPAFERAYIFAGVVGILPGAGKEVEG